MKSRHIPCHLAGAHSLAALAVFCLAVVSSGDAATIIHYWNMDTVDGDGVPQDVVGGVATTAASLADLKVENSTYGEAYPGAGNALRTIILSSSTDSSHLVADVHDGSSPTALDSGTDDFSLSLWSYNDSSDGSGRGPNVFDFLNGQTTGAQLGTDGSGNMNLRIDDDVAPADPGAFVTSSSEGIVWPVDQWAHFAVNVMRSTDTVEVFINGASVKTYSIAALDGNIFATQDMDIGVTNGGLSNNSTQNAGLDDLAFYSGILSASQVQSLASGTITPLQIPEPSGAVLLFSAVTLIRSTRRSR